MSPSPCLQRRKRLENLGVIRGYQAVLDLSCTAPFALVNVEVTLTQNTLEVSQIFEEYIRTEQSVITALSVSGAIDYILTFCLPTLVDYQRISDRIIEETGVIKKLTSYAVLSEIKQFDGYPIDLLLKEK